MRRNCAAGGLTLAALLILSGGDLQAGAPVNYLYPDMFPYVDADAPSNLKSLQAWQLSGATLKFSTLFANQGDGLFEIRKARPRARRGTSCCTRVYQPGLRPRVRRHPDRDCADSRHRGVAESERYQCDLVRGLHAFFAAGSARCRWSAHGRTGTRVQRKNELAAQLEHGTTAGPFHADYSSPDQSVQQRVSVGWADMYGAGSSGQSFDTAGIPVGPLYWLRQTVDPQNRIHETDETNNSYEILIDLNRPGEAVTFAGQFVRLGDPVPPDPGDLNEDGVIDTKDWAAFKAGANTSLDGLSKPMRTCSAI